MAVDRPRGGERFSARFYNFAAIKRDYPDQFQQPDDTLSMPPVNIVRAIPKPRTVVEPAKPKSVVIGVKL
jgi:hypothetical protein